MKIILGYLLSVFSTMASCNIRMLVSDSKVIHEQTGYLFYNNNAFFYT
jgi:hypothetical protein